MRCARNTTRPLLRALLCSAIAAAPFVGCGASPEPTRPNVLIYVIDTLRRDHLGVYGNELVDSPRIDAIAAEGLTFDYAYAPASWTRSSMASLIAGVGPTRHRTEDRDSVLPEAIVTLGEVMREAGYATALVTANPNTGRVFGFDQGFDELLELYAKQEGDVIDPHGAMARSDEVTKRAIQWLDSAKRPFLLIVLAIDPHTPHHPPEDLLRAEFEKTPLENAESDRDRIVTAFLAHYRADIAFNDRSFGRLVDHLATREELDETVLVVTADHGEEFWEHGKYQHGQSLYDEVLRIPLIIRYPRSDRIRAGTRSDTPARLADVMPTVLDLAGVAVPETVRGRSLFDPDASPPPALFSRLVLDGHDMASIRENPWKLIRDEGTDRTTLYHLVDDPDEQTPVDDPVTQRRLEALLDARIADQLEFDSEKVPVEALPDDVRESLKVLGYIE